MPRWNPGAQDRLVRAALDLFDEQGYEQTNVAEIAERAGVTERTFYRYFADKREVLFSRFGDLAGSLGTAVAEAPESASPLEAARIGLHALAGVLGDQPRELVRTRARVVANNASLRERELLKSAAWTAAIAQALRERGVADSVAEIAAGTGVAAFMVAFDRWTRPSRAPSLTRCVDDAFAQVTAI